MCFSMGGNRKGVLVLIMWLGPGVLGDHVLILFFGVEDQFFVGIF